MRQGCCPILAACRPAGSGIKRHADLQALRQRDDFKQLLAELEKKSP
jgi:hypothetical protein